METCTVVTQTRRAYVSDEDSSWEEREHHVLADERKLPHKREQPWPFFDKMKGSDTTNMTVKLTEALGSVRVLDDPAEHKEWLEEHDGMLTDVGPALTEGLRKHAPKDFVARVADFNDNLYYDMQQTRGLEHYQLEDDMAVRELEEFLQANEYLGSFLSTEHTVPQPPHVDYTYEVLKEHEKHSTLQIGFFPLTKDGMFLQIWQTTRSCHPTVRIEGEIIFIPYGKILVVPASTIHGGGFRTSSHEEAGLYGNLRFHLYVATKEAKLPVHQSNKYTEPNDKTKELSRRYVNSRYMPALMEKLFV